MWTMAERPSRENIVEAEMTFAGGFASDTMPSEEPSYSHEPEDEGASAFCYISGTGSKSFEMDAALDVPGVSLEVPAEKQTNELGRTERDMDQGEAIGNQPPTRASNVLKLSDEFKEDFIW